MSARLASRASPGLIALDLSGRCGLGPLAFTGFDGVGRRTGGHNGQGLEGEQVGARMMGSGGG